MHLFELEESWRQTKHTHIYIYIHPSCKSWQHVQAVCMSYSIGSPVVWLVGWLVGWLAGWLVGRSVGLPLCARLENGKIGAKGFAQPRGKAQHFPQALPCTPQSRTSQASLNLDQRNRNVHWPRTPFSLGVPSAPCHGRASAKAERQQVRAWPTWPCDQPKHLIVPFT